MRGYVNSAENQAATNCDNDISAPKGLGNHSCRLDMANETGNAFTQEFIARCSHQIADRTLR
jgi:hypothetical protein